VSVVCVGPKDEPDELECIDMSRESIRQAAAGTLVCMFVCIGMYVCMCVCMYVCVYACMYVSMHACGIYTKKYGFICTCCDCVFNVMYMSHSWSEVT